MPDPYPLDAETLTAAERAVGHVFSERSLLARALTHPSVNTSEGSGTDYERLEFLGDAVLGLIVVEEVYDRFPELSEGEMTKLKISVVSGATLVSAAEELGLASLIALGDSERGTGSRGLRSALENAFEALVGALYLDGGLEAARRFVIATLGSRIDPGAVQPGSLEHPKSRLQELVQSRGESVSYRIVAEEGPPHARTFVAQVSLADQVLGEGRGATKKAAEMNAADAALTRLSAS